MVTFTLVIYFFLEASNGKIWNQNWDEILCGKYEVCKFCNTTIKGHNRKRYALYNLRRKNEFKLYFFWKIEISYCGK